MPKTLKDTNRKKRSSAAPTRDAKNGTVTVSLRVPAGMLKEVDDALTRRPYKMPRHMWLLEAIHEKLMRSRQQRAEAGSFTAEDRER